MQDFLTFWTFLFESVSDFLLTPPINWFVGIFVLCGVVALVKRIISI